MTRNDRELLTVVALTIPAAWLVVLVVVALDRIGG